MSLQDRVRPWHGLMFAVFLVAAGGFLAREGVLTYGSGVTAVLYGLLALVVFQFTVGNVWAYAVEYRNAGGAWSDAPFLVPFVVAAGSAATVLVATNSLGAAAWTAFWAFVVAAAVVSLVVWLAVGYRDAGDAEPLG
ncbi:hypothetical protein [Halorarum halobium]|uniref:hypothetical protein n=1 Tax=Halorarum halobium TaxID=3075121 RepID=UPI0028B2108D|nr:hypothetical protein [Halobaculum sp. XH14]